MLVTGSTKEIVAVVEPRCEPPTEAKNNTCCWSVNDAAVLSPAMTEVVAPEPPVVMVADAGIWSMVPEPSRFRMPS